MSTELYEISLPELEVSEDVGLESRVILFNDEFHTFDEVTNQIILATKCSQSLAIALTDEVHYRGKAVVYSGDVSECLRVSGILEAIALQTQLEM